METEKISFEEAMKKLEESVSKLEKGDAKLDEAFSVFEDGLKYAKICETKLSTIEKKVAKILEENQEKELHLEEN